MINKRLLIKPDETVVNTDNFTPVTYTGNGTTQSITTGFQPDLVWVKNRSAAQSHYLFDSVRGDNAGIFPDLTDAEYTSVNYISFDSNGFTTGSTNNINTNNYVAWCWKAGGSAVSNTDGTVTSTVSANQDAGFSIVKGTAISNGAFTVGHGLSSAPELYIIKNTSGVGGWITYVQSLGADKYLTLNTSDAAGTSTLFWNNTAPSSTVFQMNAGQVITGSADFIAYCFHSVDGYQKVGSYTGDSSTSGNIITTGFQPRFLLIKNISNSTDTHWGMFDSIRDATNPNTGRLLANVSNAEVTTDSNWGFNFLSNGFEPTVGSNQVNASGSTYIYLAIA